MTLKTPAQQAEEIVKIFPSNHKHMDDGLSCVKGGCYWRPKLADAIRTAFTTLQTQHEAEITELRKAIEDAPCSQEGCCDELVEYSDHFCNENTLNVFVDCRKKQVKRKDV